MTHWLGDAVKHINQNTESLRKMFECTGCLLRANGDGNDAICPEGVVGQYDYRTDIVVNDVNCSSRELPAAGAAALLQQGEEPEPNGDDENEHPLYEPRDDLHTLDDDADDTIGDDGIDISTMQEALQRMSIGEVQHAGAQFAEQDSYDGAFEWLIQDLPPDDNESDDSGALRGSSSGAGDADVPTSAATPSS